VATYLSEPFTFGFQHGAVELTGPSGGYHLLLPGFLSVMLSPNLDYLSYGFQRVPSDKYSYVTTYYTVQCDGILQAYCIILDLIKKHKRFEFLPITLQDQVTIGSNNQPDGEVK
jgi:hypothetical protein